MARPRSSIRPLHLDAGDREQLGDASGDTAQVIEKSGDLIADKERGRAKYGLMPTTPNDDASCAPLQHLCLAEPHDQKTEQRAAEDIGGMVKAEVIRGVAEVG